jgi:hypothetical protein
MIKACFFALVLSFSLVLLKNLGWRGAPVFAALGFVLLLGELGGFFGEITKMSLAWESLGESAAAIFKIIGIGYLFGISSEICRELGEAGISSALALVGRFEVIAVALPFISEIFSIALSLLG